MLVMTNCVVLPLAAGEPAPVGFAQGLQPVMSMPLDGALLGTAGDCVVCGSSLARTSMPMACRCAKSGSVVGKVRATDSCRAGRSNANATTPATGSSRARMAASSLRQSMFEIVNTSVDATGGVLLQLAPHAGPRDPAGAGVAKTSSAAFMPISARALRSGCGVANACKTVSRRPGRSNARDSTPGSSASRALIAASSLRQSMFGILNVVRVPPAVSAGPAAEASSMFMVDPFSAIWIAHSEVGSESSTVRDSGVLVVSRTNTLK